MIQKFLFLGDEAIAQAAIDAGISGVYAYPGTPSTEITEYIQNSKEAAQNAVHSQWSANEKTAMESALGMSYAGKRTMVCMKHVGLNVAADPFMNIAITGVNGGMLIVIADDPSMHSSQNEQDSRFYGKFAMIPVLEPANQQEAYDLVFYGFELSEKYQVPVMLRITTRLSHSRSGVQTRDKRKQNELKLPEDLKQFILLPALARIRYKKLLNLQSHFLMAGENSGNNQFIDGQNRKYGIIACGLAFNYYLENKVQFGLDYPVLKITQYPIPIKLMHKIAKETDELIVLEEGYPIVEESLRGIFTQSVKIKGRMDGTLPRDGELNPNLVAVALGIEQPELLLIPEIVTDRPPALCKGCSHSDMYLALNEAIAEYGKGKVFSDIGCYTLGALPPYNAINSCVDMGASITMAKGANDAGLFPTVAVIGDSTFAHSGITGLLDAVNEHSAITVIISDNSTTGMTGGQKSSATGRIHQICQGVGVSPEHIINIVPLKKNHSVNTEILRKELAYKDVSVIIASRECIQTASRNRKETGKTE
jgi:indolepyruvate ferredoxin oxidoreductase alpha subunit